MTSPATSDLPPPSAAAANLSAELQRRIREEIRNAGQCISFARYMEMALYEPGLGYYSAGATKLGRDGDFITAPEISPLFGRCLARQVAEILEYLGGGAVLEFGAGSGRLAADLLRELDRLHCLPQRYLILEVSADLRERQRRRIETDAPQLLPRVRWLDALPADRFRGAIVANEVLDAMPVERVHKGEDRRWYERCVHDAGHGFEWIDLPVAAGSAMATALARIECDCGSLPNGYTTEINPRLLPWFRGLGAVLSGGAILIIDYGGSRREYYHLQRGDGTLLCHYRHRAHADPFTLIGLQDITAWVDFTAAAAAAHSTGFTVCGYTTQAQFLIALGITDLLAEAGSARPTERFVFAQQVQTLTLPGEMGERMKVLGLTRGMSTALRGFTTANHLHRL